MKRFTLAVGALFTLLNFLPAQAATKPAAIKMVALPSLTSGTFFQGKGGEWFETLLAQRAIYLVGTSEPASGPTQGEVVAINPVNGSQLWDLPIPTTVDAVATAATIDPLGNIWVAGSSASQVVTPTPTPTPTGVINPSGVVIKPTPPTRAGLTNITVWEISSLGTLITSYQYAASDLLSPATITYASGSLVLTGTDFKVTMNQAGKFSKFISASFAIPKAASTQTFKDGLYMWKSYISKVAIPGVIGWKPPAKGRVILKIGSRTGTVYNAYKITDQLLKSQYLAGLGVVLTTLNPNGYSISLLK
jgi:hypothetical protein